MLYLFSIYPSLKKEKNPRNIRKKKKKKIKKYQMAAINFVEYKTVIDHNKCLSENKQWPEMYREHSLNSPIHGRLEYAKWTPISEQYSKKLQGKK